MDRFVRLLDHDIEAEEQRAGCRDCRAPTYLDLARSLIARRDNLTETIVALQKRLADEEEPTEKPVGWEMKLAQPVCGRHRATYVTLACRNPNKTTTNQLGCCVNARELPPINYPAPLIALVRSVPAKLGITVGCDVAISWPVNPTAR